MVVLVVVVSLLIAAVLLSRQQRVRVDSCCARGPWPPVDLAGDPDDEPSV